jgi:hypothetical protein
MELDKWRTTKYRSKWLMVYDNRFTVRTGQEWMNRYMLRPDERPEDFEEVKENDIKQ